MQKKSTPSNPFVTSSLSRQGMIVVISAPSGGGKSTLCRELLTLEADMRISVSMTTRQQRDGEQNGVDYHFVDRDVFQRHVANGDLIEHAEVFGHHYGTPRAGVLAHLDQGHDILFDIDWQGARQVVKAFPSQTLLIFLLPPSIEVLRQRLEGRQRDSSDEVCYRMSRAANEIAHHTEYDWLVVNDKLSHAVATVRAILHAERHRRHRYTQAKHLADSLLQELKDPKNSKESHSKMGTYDRG